MLTTQHAYATLPAGDIDRARTFYEDTLGFTPHDSGNDEVTYETADGNAFMVFSSTGKPSGDHTQLSFRVDDLEREMQDLAQRGVHFEPVDMAGYDPATSIVSGEGFRGAWFHDTEGNLLVLSESRPPA